MLITNNHNLPETIINAIGSPRKPVPNRYSVTDICNPPMIRYLKEKFWDELTQDASEMLWMLLGSSVHAILEKGSPKDAFAEEKIEVSYRTSQIVGVTDLWHDSVISDHKITSVWHYLLGTNNTYTTQLNLYRWLYFVGLGIDTKKLKVNLILRDWQQNKARFDLNYPQIPFIVQNIPIIDPLPILDDWLSKIDNPPPCTAEERWERKTTWAVTKQGNKSASRVLPTEEEAVRWAKNNVDLKKTNVNISERKGEAGRCKSYCICSEFCEYNPYNWEGAI